MAVATAYRLSSEQVQRDTYKTTGGIILTGALVFTYGLIFVSPAQIMAGSVFMICGALYSLAEWIAAGTTLGTTATFGSTIATKTGSTKSKSNSIYDAPGEEEL